MSLQIDTDNLKKSAPIIPYITTFYSDKIKLERYTNDGAFAKCVFHEEDTASLMIYSNGTYKCFGCGAHGDIITLVEHMENVGFQDACTIIANNVGFDIPEVQNPQWEEYYQAMNEHGARYNQNLKDPANQAAMSYLLNERQLTIQTINAFGLGFTASNEYQFRTDIGNIGNCITFPYFSNHQSINKKPKCVGFAYKPLGDSKSKYLNDRNQDGLDGQDPRFKGVFIKGNLLYGYPMAYKSILENKFAIVVEGYFDVLSMHQSGITNVVGSMGTALTDNQITLLTKITNHVVLMMDSDSAGINAMEKIIRKLAAYGVNISICLLSNFKDPDEMCKNLKFDCKEIIKYIKESSEDGLLYLISKATRKFRNNMLMQKKSILDSFAFLNDQNINNHQLYLDTLNNYLRI